MSFTSKINPSSIYNIIFIYLIINLSDISWFSFEFLT